MKILKTKFRKNDLYYTLICRNDKVAMYETRQEEASVLCNNEVIRIYIMPAHTAIGVVYTLTQNSPLWWILIFLNRIGPTGLI